MSVMVLTDCCWIPSAADVVAKQEQQQRRNNNKRRVTFCSCDGDDEHPVTQVIEVTHNYPSDYFYTRSELARFRREVSEERRLSSSPSCSSSSSTFSPVERALNIVTSSLLIATLFIFALLATTIASLPILLFLKIASLLFSGKEEDDVDSSIRPYSPPSSSKVSLSSKGNSNEAGLVSFTERMLYSLMGDYSSSVDGSSVGGIKESSSTQERSKKVMLAKQCLSQL
ncbi:hypothetical protein ACHAWU_006619 [Discostella pseudostelligera]|uniref:Uncharacterized protein n=1 Tax=Discostella pseudostelligera TaxID=259834 RepID=A0ABD3MDS0_9STRA